MKKVYFSFSVLFAFFCGLVTQAQMNGVYTLDNTIPSSATNFTSFTQLSATLSASGVSGPVTVNVGSTSGPYTEQVTIPQVTGASATNSIVINGNGRTLTYAAGTGTLKSTLQLTGTDFLTINNLTVSATNATNAFAVHLWNGANNNSFNNCLFTAPMAGTGTSLCPFSVSGSSSVAASTGTAGSNITLNTCTTSGGYYGIIFYGSSSVTHSNNIVVNCTVRDFYLEGIYTYYMLSPVIRGNIIERPNRTTTGTGPDGILISTGTTNALVERNHIRRFYDAFTSLNAGGGYGIYLSADATAANPNIVRNNVVSNMTSNGTQGGIYATSAAFTHMYHNTISLADATSASGTTYGIYCTGPDNIIMNNLVSITRGGTGTKYVLYVSTAAEPSLISDYNALYINSSAGTNYIGDLTASYATLAAWQAGTGFDLHSVSADPLFANPSTFDYSPTSLAVNNKGQYVGILTDFLLNPRSPLAPDPGAYEVYNTNCVGAPPANSFLAPTNSVCPGTVLNFNLQTTSTYTNMGYTVQWMTSTVSVGGYTAIPGATLNAFTTPPTFVDTYFQAVITCTNSNQTTSTPIGSVIISAPVVDTVPYYEGFENLAYHGLPNCSWSATNFNTETFVSQTAQSGNRIPRNGNGYATFAAGSVNYFYTNKIALNAGVTYSAALWYLPDNVNYNSWSDISILVGPNQSPSGLVNIASQTPVSGNFYNLLSNTFTVSTSGQYYVAIKATSGGGTAPYLTWDDLSITIPCSLNSPTLSLLSPTNSICFGKSVNLTALGADSYSWNTGEQTSLITVAPTNNTTYVVTGYNTTSGCASSSSVSINVNPLPQIAAFANYPSICTGQSSTLSASGANNLYWTNGFSGNTTVVSPTATTIYSVSGTSTLGCSGFTTIQVVVNQMPVLAIQSTPSVACQGDAVILTGTGASNYTWTSPQLFVSGSSVTVSPMASTIFTLIGTDVNGCTTNTTMALLVEECTSIQEHLVSGVNLYPNPAIERLMITSSSSVSEALVADVTGRVIFKANPGAASFELNVSHLAPGVYHVRVADNAGIHTLRFIKQ